jgi:hypothetical protein
MRVADWVSANGPVLRGQLHSFAFCVAWSKDAMVLIMVWCEGRETDREWVGATAPRDVHVLA